MRLGALALLAVLPAAAQVEGSTGSVAGIVVDQQTRRPIRGAHVLLTIGDLHGEETSDFAGRFRFEKAPVGPARLTAVKPGFQGAEVNLSIAADEEASGLEAELRRYPVIAGRVVDHRDRPVVGATVAVLQPWRLDGIPGGRVMEFGAVSSSMPTTFSTNDLGEYRAWALNPGAYVVAVVPEREPAGAGRVRFRAPGRFLPGAESGVDADPVTVSWGDIREGVDLRLAAPAATRAALRQTLAPATRPCPNCRVKVVLEQGNVLLPVAETKFDAAGRLVLEGLAPGRYAVHVQGFEREEGGNWLGLEYFEVVRDRPQIVEVPSSNQVPVRGHAVLEGDPPEAPDGGPAWSGAVGMRWEPKYLRLIVQPGGMTAKVELREREAPFEFQFFPMDGVLQLFGPPQVYIASVTLDGQARESGLLRVPPGGIAGGLEVRLRADTGTLEGVVEGIADGDRYSLHARPVRGAGVFLPQRRPSLVAPDGTYQLTLPPGVYDVVATQSRMELGDPTLKEKLQAATRRVEVKPNKTETLPLSAVR